jgi:hypothetical protein
MMEEESEGVLEGREKMGRSEEKEEVVGERVDGMAEEEAAEGAESR